MNTGDIQIALPASKSLSNRWVMINNIMHGAFVLRNVSDSDDTRLMRSLLTQADKGAGSVYYCGNAGTVARFMIAYLALREGTHIVTGDERLCQRPIDDLVQSLNSIGLNIRYTEQQGCLPVQIIGAVPKRKMLSLRASKSSQFASALMLAGSTLPTGLTINLVGRVVSRPYIEMTAHVMRKAGIDVSVSPNGHTYMVAGAAPQAIRKTTVVMENDWSAASYFYAMAALMPEVRLRLRGLSLDSCQGDAVVSQLFRQLGVDTQQVHAPYRKDATSLRIARTEQPSKRLVYNFTDNPDLFPTVAVACAALGVDAHLKGINNLRHKESDRINAVSTELQRMGCIIDVSDTLMRIHPSHLTPVDVINSHGDHRIAMAFAPLMLIYDEMTIDNPEVVNKSFPTFWQQFQQVKRAYCKRQSN